MQQHNSTIEDDADPRKYEAGEILYFGRYDADEILGQFAEGDRLCVLERNGCGMGIDVERTSDGLQDMVFPTEVKLWWNA